MLIQKAENCDLSEILELQKQAFYSEAEACNDFTIAPLTQTIESIEEEYKSKAIIKATLDGKIVGSIRLYEKEKTCFIERLVVSPMQQNKGIGSQLLNYVEQEFTTCKRFELFTGKHSSRNLYFYRKHGYRIFREEQVNDRLCLVFMEKQSLTGS